MNAAYCTAGQKALLVEGACALPQLVEAESFALLEFTYFNYSEYSRTRRC